MKKYQRVGVIILVIAGIFILYCVFRPMQYHIPADSEQGFMAVAMTTPSFEYNEQSNEAVGDIELKSYSIPEQEATEIKKEVLELISQLKYHRTPGTLVQNIKKATEFRQIEGSIWITTARTEKLINNSKNDVSLKDYDNNIRICGKYIIISNKIYSLGNDGEHKAAWIYAQIEELLKEKAENYLIKKEVSDEQKEKLCAI